MDTHPHPAYSAGAILQVKSHRFPGLSREKDKGQDDVALSLLLRNTLRIALSAHSFETDVQVSEKRESLSKTANFHLVSSTWFIGSTSRSPTPTCRGRRSRTAPRRSRAITSSTRQP